MEFIKNNFYIFIFLFVSTVTSPIDANLADIIKHNKLSKSLDKEDYEITPEDENLIFDLIEKDESIMQYNLGVLYLKKKQINLAKKQFQYVVEEQNNASPKARLQATFNMGVILSKEQSIDEAISYYQKVLDIDPEHVEAKHNIELLLKQSGGQENSQPDKQADKQSGNQANGQDKNKDTNDTSGDVQKDGAGNNNEMLPNQTLSDEEEEAILNELIRQENEIRKRQRRPIKNTNKDW